MRALAEACARGEIPAEVALVVSPVEATPAVEWARASGLEVAVLDPGHESYGGTLLAALRSAGATHLCLAGYLRLLPTAVLSSFPRKVLNIHPALLPKFGGKGMYGKRVHEAVLASGDQESGCTVHFVNEVYDEGEIVLQIRCPVMPGDTAESLAERVLELEHAAYVEAIRKVIEANGA
jgi:formyltetrahydrofolate-dependent phosphoribosylglycinamide formyltransferase